MVKSHVVKSHVVKSHVVKSHLVKQRHLNSSRTLPSANTEVTLHNCSVKVKVWSFFYDALIDTGATISAIESNVLKGLRDNRIPMVARKVRMKCSLANGQKVFIKKQVSIDITIQDTTLPVTFLVFPTLSKPIILGSDFLHRHKATISFSEGTAGLSLQHPVVSLSNITLPPRSDLIIPAKISSILPLAHYLEGQCVPYKPLMNDRMAVANSLVTSRSGKIPVRICNFSTVPVCITKGQRIASFQAGVPEKVGPPNLNSTNNGSVPITDAGTWLQVDLSKTLLSEGEGRKLQGFLHKHGDVFVQPGGQLGKTHVTTHHIPLRNGAQPVHKLPYRQSPQMREQMDKIIQNHLRQGIIEPTTSGEWASRAFLVKKPGGGYRMVADYRDLNAQTITQFLGVSRVDETLDEVGAKNPTIFSCLDLEQGFHQVAIAEEDRDKTAFLTYSGKFRYTTMPMGLKNAPKSFQSMMDFILSGVKYKNCYL